MSVEDIKRWLWQQPFHPFRIWILEQTEYQVHHPELVMLRLASLDYFIPAQQQPIPFAEQRITISLRHITRLEQLPRTPAGSAGNGDAP